VFNEVKFENRYDNPIIKSENGLDCIDEYSYHSGSSLESDSEKESIKYMNTKRKSSSE